VSKPKKSKKGPQQALRDWNRGEDEDLDLLSRAEAAFSPRGFSAASGPGVGMDLLNQAMNAEPDPALPGPAKSAFYRKQDKVRERAGDFFRDAAEFSGKKPGGIELPEPAYRRRQAEEQADAEREAEKAVQRQGLSAEDYWERNPEAKRTAVNSRGETVDVMDMARDYQKSEAERAGHEARVAEMREKGRNRRKEMENEQLQAQLKRKGIPLEAASTEVEMTYLDELSGTKGTPTGFDANKARGLLSAATFQKWDDDRALDEAGERARQANAKTLRYWQNAQEGRYGVAAQRDAMQNQDLIQTLLNNKASGEANPDRMDEAGFWRTAAEGKYNAAVRTQQAASNMDEVANLQNRSVEQISEMFGASFETVSEMLKDGLSLKELEELRRIQEDLEAEA
jgi:hypothetical protein